MEQARATSVRAHDDGVDRWRMTEAAPAPGLRARVAAYSDYWEHTASFSARRELAATCGVLIYILGEPLEIIGADGRAILVRAGEAFVGGVADATSVTRALGPQAGLHVYLPLASLAAVAGVPLAEIANMVVPFRDLAGAAADELGGRLCDSGSAEERFGHLDAFLADRLAQAAEPDRPIAYAMRRLSAPSASTSVEIAEEIGWSPRHLARRFGAAVGLAPDRYRRLARFERFAAALAQAPRDSLAGLAVECGYVDQAHLTREVREFAAMTPGELRARLIPGEGGVRDD